MAENSTDGILSTAVYVSTKVTVEINYYEVLEVSKDATPEQIKRQYYVLAKKYHPDKNQGSVEAHERFKMIGEAYQVGELIVHQRI